MAESEHETISIRGGAPAASMWALGLKCLRRGKEQVNKSQTLTAHGSAGWEGGDSGDRLSV